METMRMLLLAVLAAVALQAQPDTRARFEAVSVKPSFASNAPGRPQRVSARQDLPFAHPPQHHDSHGLRRAAFRRLWWAPMA